MGVTDGDVMSQQATGNVTFDTEVVRVEGVRQSAIRAASVSQATVVTAEIAYYRAVLAAAKTLGTNQAEALHALWNLGVKEA